MGTNYYLREKEGSRHKCEHCGHVNGERHIGKSSYGWHFSLHVIPEEGINTLQDWITKFNNPLYEIYDEYGEQKSPERMIEIITKRERPPLKFPYEDKIEGNLYRSLEDYCRRNNLELGLGNLFRHPLSQWCIGHGDGTYDYMIGNFS